MAVLVLKRHHRFSVTSGLGASLRTVPRATTASGHGAGMVQVKIKRIGRIHFEQVPSPQGPELTDLRSRRYDAPRPETGASGSNSRFNGAGGKGTRVQARA